METIYFRIAEQVLQLSMPLGSQWEQLLPSFVPFAYTCPLGAKIMCSLQVVPNEPAADLSAATFLADIDRMQGERFRLYQSEHLYILDLERAGGRKHYQMTSNLFFTKGYAYIGSSGAQSGEILNTFLMMLFAQSAVLHRTCLLHASVVMKGGIGYAFLGKSGTGKSTHTSLWLKAFPDAELLNDDNPAVHISEQGHLHIYGTPWSGKTPCYKNKKVKLGAWVRLEQADVNTFFWKSGADAFVTLLPSCSSMRWNERLYAALCDLLEDFIRHVPVGHLRCRPDVDAALLCYNQLIKKQI